MCRVYTYVFSNANGSSIVIDCNSNISSGNQFSENKCIVLQKYLPSTDNYKWQYLSTDASDSGLSNSLSGFYLNAFGVPSNGYSNNGYLTFSYGSKN